MGDLCYLRITLKREDLDRFGRYMSCKPGERWWDVEEDGGTGTRWRATRICLS